MKKQFLLIAAFGALVLASCGGEEKKEDNAAETQAKVDSAVAAREAEMARVNDSILQATVAAEKQRVEDSMAAEAAKKGSKKSTTKKADPPPASPAPPPPPPPTIGNGKPKVTNQGTTNPNGDQQTIGNGKPKIK